METAQPPRDTDDRFAFGRNWSRFVRSVDEDRIEASVAGLTDLVPRATLDGATFLDIGSGSGLSSLAAYRCGASVTAFDYDEDSVATTRQLLERYADAGRPWRVERGSALDDTFLRDLGTFDVVYSWGVLHHTGDMSRALSNAAIPVREGGTLVVAIYNDQGAASRRWTRVKHRYVHSGRLVQGLLVFLALLYVYVPSAARRPAAWAARRLRGASAAEDATGTTPPARRRRGMNRWHDLIDWVGGYPFEVAKPEEIVAVYRDLGFDLVTMTTVGGGLGCNEFVFERRRTA